ncbi:MAG TPA: PDZ domain-containing protein [Pirellulales bacterium]
MKRAVCLIACCLLPPCLSRADDDLDAREQRAIQAAVERVAPAVVGIETIGGLDRIGQLLLPTGPTTGLIVSADGYIVSSAFNFAQKPSSTIVTLADGTRLPAQLVATDRSRMLVLLKVAAERPLPTCEATPVNEIRVGWWAIALGRAYDMARPNISVGIVSAVDRLSGRVIQTDAKISPTNYGGPLVDIHGRVMGVLSPLSPQKSGEVSGVEWYDSGIGFAAPLEHIQQVLPRWKAGDLKPGLLGVSLKGGDVYADAPVIAAARPNSPAYKAGLKPGDKVVSVADRAIARARQLLDEVHGRYAGDKLTITVERGKERLVREIELVDHLDPYQRAFLGVLPERGGHEGVMVRFVYDDSPAAKAGVQAGDRITSLADRRINAQGDLLEVTAAAEAGQKAALEVRRGDETLKFDIRWQAEPEAVPAELPAQTPLGELEAPRPTVGKSTVRVAELKNEALVYVPPSYDPRRPAALVVWLHPPAEAPTEEALLATWKDRCEKGAFILLAPKAAESANWQADDFEFIRKAIEQLRKTHQIDPLRVVAWGEEVGGAVAYAWAFNQREMVRGVVALRAPLASAAIDNDPVLRFDVFATNAPDARFSKLTAAAIQALRERKFAVTFKEQAEHTPPLSDDELSEVLRWIDSLDKF